MQVRANEEAERAQLNRLLLRYQSNPARVRFEDPLRNVCLKCGTSVNWEGLTRKCPSCKESWYSSHCSCQNGRVDSRDPDTPRCSDCGGFGARTAEPARMVAGLIHQSQYHLARDKERNLETALIDGRAE